LEDHAVHTMLKASALLALVAMSPARAMAADYLEYEAPARRPVVHTQTRVLPPIIRREVVEQPIIREQVVVPRVVTRRIVRPTRVVQRRVIARPVYVEQDIVVRRPRLVEDYVTPVYRRPRAVFADRPWGGHWRGERHAWGGGYGGGYGAYRW
jgi:hypothetical protein